MVRRRLSQLQTMWITLATLPEENSSCNFTLRRILSHGLTSVGLGSDYDGIETVPVGLEDVSTYPALVRALGLFLTSSN